MKQNLGKKKTYTSIDAQFTCIIKQNGKKIYIFKDQS